MLLPNINFILTSSPLRFTLASELDKSHLKLLLISRKHKYAIKVLNIPVTKITIAFTDSSLEPEEKDAEVQNLLEQILDFEGVEAYKAVDPTPPSDSKSVGGFIVGKLTAEINGSSTKKVFQFLTERLSRKPIEMTVEENGKKLVVKVSSPDELKLAVRQALTFLNS